MSAVPGYHVGLDLWCLQYLGITWGWTCGVSVVPGFAADGREGADAAAVQLVAPPGAEQLEVERLVVLPRVLRREAQLQHQLLPRRDHPPVARRPVITTDTCSHNHRHMPTQPPTRVEITTDTCSNNHDTCSKTTNTCTDMCSNNHQLFIRGINHRQLREEGQVL